ncbi:hypothetical protein FNV43_RR13803 [Rhamnella rubrinervis]|uniref:Uncharacterized protein n=1 Tax=Rhamnella rubrinervis TaxID=2594499 RepID=A0A8K0MFS7_9ROSA|nr:hypothetical protein FNV43_RR13803 [Rhamnella rubrinervis]
MAQSQSVKILEVCQIAPPTSDSAAPKSLPLTFFDIYWLRLQPIHRLFIYEVPCIDTHIFLDSILPKLKHSLSLTLHHFLPLAGSLTWPQDSPKPLLNYVEGDGVSLTVAESSTAGLFHDLCRNDIRDAAKCRPFLPNLSVSPDRAALLELQVTVFPNHGFCIGIVPHHGVLDGKTSTSFIKSWAHICKLAETKELLSPPPSIPEQLTPFYDRAVIEDSGELEATYVDVLLKHGVPHSRSLKLMEVPPTPPGSVQATLELRKDDIVKLRKHVSGRNKSIRVSTYSLTCGYTWFCSVKSLGVEKGMRTSFTLPVDCRSRLKPALPSTYFGNCILIQKAYAEAEDILGEDGIVSAVEAISEALRELDESDDVLVGFKGLASFIATSMTKPEIRFGFAGSNRFEEYGIDFGWGRPKKVEMIRPYKEGTYSMIDSKNGDGGVEIGLVLEKDKMEAFVSEFTKGLKTL